MCPGQRDKSGVSCLFFQLLFYDLVPFPVMTSFFFDYLELPSHSLVDIISMEVAQRLLLFCYCNFNQKKMGTSLKRRSRYKDNEMIENEM